MTLAGTDAVTSIQKAASHDFTRPCANFRPCIWGDVFLHYHSESLEANNDSTKQQFQAYKEEVKKMFQCSSNNISQQLKLIDSIQRLGISYHFEHEISEALEQINNTFAANDFPSSQDGDELQYLALLFRLLRQQGYRISSDIFYKFKNDKGEFNDTIAQDVFGLWELYEAAQLRIHGEEILEEALHFTYTNLESKTNQLSSSLAAQINRSLRLPLHKELPRMVARRYMSFYEEDPSHSKVLLNFAKMDFNMTQKLHQEEVASNTKWWKKADYLTKVPYIRDRVVESYFVAFMSHEPQYSNSRRLVGKMVSSIGLLDDTYDAYGTIEELEIFTKAIQRWDISLIESLPECMKVVFDAIVELWDEIEMVISEGGDSSLISLFEQVKQSYCDLAHGYMVEAKWCHEGYTPTYDEYKANGAISIGVPLLIRSCFYLGESASKQVLDWIISHPKLMQDVSILARLRNDLASNKREQQHGVHVASSIECCMKQYGVSREETYKIILKEIENIWKDINEACLKLDDQVLEPAELNCIVNYGRLAEVFYGSCDDGFTNGEILKDYVAKLLLDPIVM